jgi:hypothetical protein
VKQGCTADSFTVRPWQRRHSVMGDFCLWRGRGKYEFDYKTMATFDLKIKIS